MVKTVITVILEIVIVHVVKTLVLLSAYHLCVDQASAFWNEVSTFSIVYILLFLF